MTTPLPSVPPPLLEARAIERRYDRHPVWTDVSFDVHPGEVVLVLGGNGVGKSTLLRALAGLARPSRGAVCLLGRDPYADPAARTAIGLLGHATSLYGDLTARENLRFAAMLHGLPDTPDRITAALSEAGLAERADQRVARFSRGLAQRLALARVRLHAPRLLLLDEPFTGLDESGTQALQAMLRRGRDAGDAVLCVTHDPAELWPLATRILLLGRRRLLLDIPRPADPADWQRHLRETAA